MSNPIVSQVVEQLTALPYNLQRQVLDFVRALKASTQHGVPGKQLLRFAGFIPLDDLQAMRQAIDTGCGQVDLSEWQIPGRMLNLAFTILEPQRQPRPL